MGKKDNSAKIRELRGKVHTLNTELEALQELLRQLNDAYTSIKYALVSHSNIKGNYILAGMKYLEATNSEQEMLKNEQRNLMTHRDNAAESVKTKISSVSARIENLNNEIRNLS